MNSNELFTKTANLGGLCIDGLKRSFLSSNKGVYSIDEFKAMLVPSLIWRNGPSLEFWKEGERKQKFVRISNQLLIIFKEKERIILSDFAELSINRFVGEYLSFPHFEFSINRFVGEYLSFPHFEFTWVERSIEGTPMGILRFARVDLSSSNFVSYQYCGFLQKYNSYSPQKGDLQDLGLPENLAEVDNILGVSLKKEIKFNKRIEEIRKNLELEKFYQALSNCT
ncbi:MAG: hypothetical protein U9P70_03395 [Patescibacteria group bacterium]|nr:hypothetical protein [Patescibacteria group bacterium]